MNNYRIPLVWQMYGHINVEAESLDKAVEYALGPECPLPEGTYIDDSIQVDDTLLELNGLDGKELPLSDESQNRAFCVETPYGKLLVTAKTAVDDPEDFPGIYVDLVRADSEKVLLACTEYESLTKMLQTCVYGDGLLDEPTEVVAHENLDFGM